MPGMPGGKPAHAAVLPSDEEDSDEEEDFVVLLFCLFVLRYFCFNFGFTRHAILYVGANISQQRDEDLCISFPTRQEPLAAPGEQRWS